MVLVRKFRLYKEDFDIWSKSFPLCGTGITVWLGNKTTHSTQLTTEQSSSTYAGVLKQLLTPFFFFKCEFIEITYWNRIASSFSVSKQFIPFFLRSTRCHPCSRVSPSSHRSLAFDWPLCSSSVLTGSRGFPADGTALLRPLAHWAAASPFQWPHAGLPMNIKRWT